LERLLARRIAMLAIEHEILPEQYFGALPKRSSTDLVACLGIAAPERCHLLHVWKIDDGIRAGQ
jgi:hypothetical protein